MFRNKFATFLASRGEVAEGLLGLGRNRSSVAEATAAADVLLDSRGRRREDVCESTEYPRPYSQVPGPTPLPIIGNTWRLLPIVGQYQISDIAKIAGLLYQAYGKIVTLRGLVGRPDLLFIYDVDEIEKIYRQEGSTPFRPSMPCLVKYKSVIRKDFFGELPGVVGVHGKQWKDFRSKVGPTCLKPSTVKKYVRPIEDITECFVKRMIEMRDDKMEMPADFDNEIHKWSLECIGQVALDVRLGCLSPNLANNSEPQRIIDAAKYALRNIALLELKFPFWRYLPSNLWKNYVKNMDYFVEICMKYINESLERMKNKSSLEERDLSLIERILVTESDPKIACILALDLILVGIDTISMAVCSILYQLATRPEEQEKIYRELLAAIPDPNVKLSAEQLDQLPYLKSFVKEVFRMYSTVIGNGRTLQEDTVICNYLIPKGTQLVFPTLVTGQMPEYVSDAQHFYPERWLKQSSEANHLHPFASLPYGHGARMCLGRRFADLEIQILLSKLLRSYKLEFHHDPLEYKVTFMYAPDGELRFKLTERQQ